MNGNPLEKLLNCSDLANWLNIKESTIRKKVLNNRIPYLKIGSSVRFRVEDIERWLDENNPQNVRWTTHQGDGRILEPGGLADRRQ